MLRIILSVSIIAAGALCAPEASAQEAEQPQQADQALELDREASINTVSYSISVQGNLLDGGSPADGLYDFELKIYDALSSGAQQGSTVLAGNRLVTDGVFSIEASFGTAQFWENDRWIQIGVRDGASTGSYEILTPRSKIVAAPLALALPGVYASPSGNFVGIGRSNKIGNESFGINYTSTTGYGGMYVNTTGASGKPFYGYATGNSGHAWSYLNGATSKWHLYYGGDRLTVQSNGNVGIGTTSPAKLLHVQGADSDILIGDPAAEHMLLEGNIGSGAIARFYTAANKETVRINSHGTDATGQILMYSVDGLTPTVNINAVEAPGQGSQITLYNGNGTATIELDADYGAGTGQPGRITVDELELNGSDLAEHFDIHAASTESGPEPGYVVSIDPNHPGELRVADEAYDKKVVGVISGAGGIRTGIYMSQKGTLADGAHPVAVAGRVYVWADAEAGAIEPGDMLTTSPRPGLLSRVIC